MRAAIVDLDHEPRRAARHPGRDGGITAALLFATGLFALAVWIARPAASPAVVGPPDDAASAPSFTGVSSALVPRGAVLHPLSLPPSLTNVDLGVLPERLANEAAPYEWRRVITVRGTAGVASVEGPMVISWSENGILYWLSSPTLSTEELIRIADGLR